MRRMAASRTAYSKTQILNELEKKFDIVHRNTIGAILWRGSWRCLLERNYRGMRKGSKDEEGDVGLAPYSGPSRRRHGAKDVFAKIQEKKRLQAALLAIKTDIDAGTQALSAVERRRLDELLTNKCSRAGCESPARIKGRCQRHYVQDWFSAQGPCSVPGCRKQAHTSKMCQEHYSALLKPKIPCSIDDCETPVFAKGMCQRHYRRAHVHGDPHVVLRDHLFKKIEQPMVASATSGRANQKLDVGR